ncbi:hypothetical protein CYMTET_5219 [Cymbomonas tetramitiformis]|uniref:Uncharacterized protein n=1 Tax=Cymbomonas tetramitiformis TaxID=36881 RepID=A0AAE0GZK1_9CHLO|nr:hypothetical protein CYMTET_5219 [Cymbomonas tetramitiformis]
MWAKMTFGKTVVNVGQGAKKCFGDTHVRFTGTESNDETVFTRLMDALKEACIAEDAAFNSLSSLNATQWLRSGKVEFSAGRIRRLTSKLTGPSPC